MPFIIEWTEHCGGLNQSIAVATPAAVLELTVCGDVIVGTDWLLDGDNRSCDVSGGHDQWPEIRQDEDPDISVRLLKQGSPYRQLVWSELCRIPFGTTLSYSALAARIGSSPRAVGNACRDNPYPFIIPCHRVVSANGLGGYCGKTGGGYLDIKSRLLEFESTCKHRMPTV